MYIKIIQHEEVEVSNYDAFAYVQPGATVQAIQQCQKWALLRYYICTRYVLSTL